MSNGDMADPTTSGVVSSGTTPSSNRSLKDDGHNVETTVMSDAIVECLRGAESDSISGKELSNLVVDLPSTSDTQSTNLTLNSTYWRPGYPFASKSKSSSSAGKRKAALPKKRPAALEGPVNISADTGEVEEDSTSAAAEIVLGVDESGPVTRTGSKRLIAYRKKPATSRLAKSTTSEVIDDEKSAVGTNIDCNLLNAFPLVEIVGYVDGSANEFTSKGITDVGIEKESSTRMCGKSGEQGSPSNCWTMQRCTGKGNTKREIDEKREEDLKDGMCIIMGSDRGEKPISSTDESLRKEHSESINKSAMSTSASTDVLNGLCVNSLADISGLLFNPSNSTALNNLLLGGTGGVTDVNALNALTTPDLLTATAATGMLPFICANLAEFSADQQKMQMALIEAATAAANSTLCGLISEKAVGAERESSSVGSLKQASSIMPSTSSKQMGSALLAPVIINGKEGTHTIKGKTVGSSGQQTDSNSEGLSMGMSLPAVMPEMNGTQTVGELLDPLMSESKSTFGQRLVTTDDETVKGATQSITREDRIDLEELENFAQTFKKQRIKFGFTQGDVGMALGRRYGTDFSQTTISRFEALNLSFKNMCKLRPLLKEWLADAEAAIANGASASDLLEAQRNDSSMAQSGTPTGIQVAAMVNSATEGSPSPNGSCIGTPGIPLRKRRKRTNLDAAQRAALDGYFQLNPRPDHDRMAQIAGTLDLDRDVVRVWFCNRRQKLRKE